MTRCCAGDLAVFDSGPRTDLIGVFVQIEGAADDIGRILPLAGPHWWVKVLGAAVLSDEGKLTRKGFAPDWSLKPIRPRPEDREIPALLRRPTPERVG